MNDSWNRPAPIVDPETAPFWDACNESTFLIQRCGICGEYQYPYRGFCCHCWSSEVEDHPIDGDGTVWTFTVIERTRAPGFSDRTPYVVALIEVREGIRILTNIINCDVDQVEIGMPVRLTFVDGPASQKMPMFELGA